MGKLQIETLILLNSGINFYQKAVLITNKLLASYLMILDLSNTHLKSLYQRVKYF